MIRNYVFAVLAPLMLFGCSHHPNAPFQREKRLVEIRRYDLNVVQYVKFNYDENGLICSINVTEDEEYPPYKIEYGENKIDYDMMDWSYELEDGLVRSYHNKKWTFIDGKVNKGEEGDYLLAWDGNNVVCTGDGIYVYSNEKCPSPLIYFFENRSPYDDVSNGSLGYVPMPTILFAEGFFGTPMTTNLIDRVYIYDASPDSPFVFEYTFDDDGYLSSYVRSRYYEYCDETMSYKTEFKWE